MFNVIYKFYFNFNLIKYFQVIIFIYCSVIHYLFVTYSFKIIVSLLVIVYSLMVNYYVKNIYHRFFLHRY